MTLDPRTMFVMGASFLIVTAVTLGLLVRTLPKDIRRSAVTGARATALLAVSWLLYAFVVLLPGMDDANARALVPRLRESIASQSLEYPIKLDVGIGRATLMLGSPKGAGPADAAALVRRLIAEADKDLYSIKNTRF